MNEQKIRLTNSNILVVDDVRANLRLLTGILSEQGYIVRPAPSGSHALTAAKAEPPDLILLDIKMPEMSGYEVCEHLKADPLTRDVPIIFISALNDTFDKVKAFSLGAVDYMTKPFQHEEVLARVKAHLTIRKQQQQIQQQNSDLEAQTHAALQLNGKLQQEIRERRRAEAELAKANKELQRLASLDGLTQLANRRRFDEYLTQEWQRMTREQQSLAVILCDIDYFKRYNDTYGHQAGDDCLKQVAQALRRSVKRPADMVARYGGEEFVLVLPHTDIEGARHIARTIQEEIRLLRIPHVESSVNPYITLSIGVTCSIPAYKSSADILIRMADKALYDVKEHGRNAIVVNAP